MTLNSWLRWPDFCGHSRTFPQMPISETDEPIEIAAKELIAQMDAFVTFMDVYGTERFAQDFVAGLGILFALIAYDHEIAELRPAPDNPVTLSAIQADGILQFANRVQQQTLLVELQGSDDTDFTNNTGGIRFIRPPARDR
ncbi:hypothetical protein [Yoonia sp. BS5-3]|uniref:Uncharacterized protein n=1 Tax=Yoonia phaeophyticola TaxID=3137369 RepID=A0ABZ2V803_9RHOB